MDELTYPVPPAPPHARPATLAWLRASVPRFTDGDDHRRRRALVIAELSRLDEAALRQAAAIRTKDLAGMPIEDLARAVPVGVLSADRVDVADVRTVARVYLTGDPSSEADDAVARLVAALGGPDEETAARIAVLVQACEATAGLILNAVKRPPAPADARLAETLAHDSPIRATRRVGPTGEVIPVDLSRRPFGEGAHACPGRSHALALAAGVLEAL
jgi:hypothetical protein